MQIVIDVPDEMYDWFDNGFPDENDAEKLWQIVKNGKPLPKGHWIHRTQDGGCFWEECSMCHTERAFSTKYCPDCGTYMYADIRTEAPTIIEADKEDNNIFEKMTEEERTFAWMYMIFNKDKIIEKTEQWTKEAEEAGMTLTEYLKSINPLNDKEKLSWLGKDCKDCCDEKCKELGTLPKGYDCALWKGESEE